ncbi:early nodulin-like protein 14 [Vicia villosa]|uniref:early nodulin-like protein 14 n=1 Tax=Vicia villosa TaxID=3911 RepID=UPI00273A93B6|nr:early nodulin-like protein 14 [Vicia villosa]
MAVLSTCSLFILFLVFAFAAAAPTGTDYLLGGKPDAWKVPSESDSLNKWAESVRFNIGDHLIFTYEAGKDSVLEVSKENYMSCNTSGAIKMYNDGKTKVRFDLSGPYYFISGEKGHCEKGEKVTVVVISPRSPRSDVPVSPSPSPAGAKGPGPAVAPSPKSSANVLQGGGVLMAMGVVVAAMWFF